MSNLKERLPVERSSNVARINRTEHHPQIRRQCPGKKSPHATLGVIVEEVLDTETDDQGRDRGDDASDETAREDARDVGRCGHGEAEDAVEEGGTDVQRSASEPVGIRGEQ